MINAELIVETLHKHEAPRKVLEEFLPFVSDSDISLTMGKQYGCHRFVLDTLLSQRDRLAFLEYKEKLAPQSEDYFYAENAFRTFVSAILVSCNYDVFSVDLF